MSKWYDYKEEETDIDVETGCVDICLGYDRDGRIYLSIPFTDIKAICKKIDEKEEGDSR